MLNGGIRIRSRQFLKQDKPLRFDVSKRMLSWVESARYVVLTIQWCLSSTTRMVVAIGTERKLVRQCVIGLYTTQKRREKNLNCCALTVIGDYIPLSIY